MPSVIRHPPAGGDGGTVGRIRQPHARLVAVHLIQRGRTRAAVEDLHIGPQPETGRDRVWMKTDLGMNRRRRRHSVVAALQGGGMSRTESRAEIGALGEQIAVDYLCGLGLRVVERNWRCRYGELDVIAADDTSRAVVFVEVKTRTTDQFGGVAHAVTPQKVRRLRRLAGVWLAQQGTRWATVRIDVVTVRIGRRRTPELTHIEGVG
jgi:putative endonuclease